MNASDKLFNSLVNLTEKYPNVEFKFLLSELKDIIKIPLLTFPSWSNHNFNCNQYNLVFKSDELLIEVKIEKCTDHYNRQFNRYGIERFKISNIKKEKIQ